LDHDQLMASRLDLAAENNATPPSRRSKAAGKTAGAKSTFSAGQTCSTTIHWDVAAVVRWALFGTAAVVLAIATLIIAIRGEENYPAATAIKAIGSVGQDVATHRTIRQ
jgi:hypothetical protein